MEVMRAHIKIAQCKRTYSRPSNVEYTVLILKDHPFDMQILSVCDGNMISFVEMRIDAGIRDAGLIFHADKDKTFCSSWPLERNHRTRTATMP